MVLCRVCLPFPLTLTLLTPNFSFPGDLRVASLPPSESVCGDWGFKSLGVPRRGSVSQKKNIQTLEQQEQREEAISGA